VLLSDHMLTNYGKTRSNTRSNTSNGDGSPASLLQCSHDTRFYLNGDFPELTKVCGLLAIATSR